MCVCMCIVKYGRHAKALKYESCTSINGMVMGFTVTMATV